EGPVEDLGPLLRVEPLGHGRRALDVAEEDRHYPALALHAARPGARRLQLGQQRRGDVLAQGIVRAVAAHCRGLPPPRRAARAESLLAYLVLHRDAPQPRQRLAFLLWPDSTEPQARTNLRHLLHTLRRTLPSLVRFLDVTPRALQWRTDAPLWLDVAAFEAA